MAHCVKTRLCFPESLLVVFKSILSRYSRSTGDAVLGRTTQEKDLGVTFSADMKVSEQCGIAASKGNQILGLVRRTIMYKEKQLIVPLYKAIVRPHLEYCIQAWRPYHKKGHRQAKKNSTESN